MESSASLPARPDRWTSLWVVALLSLLGQLWLCQFFSFGEQVPISIDVNPSNLWKLAYHFPPTGSFEVLNWLGVAYLPQPLNPLSLAAHLSPWWFFTAYTPLIATLALLAMAAFLRELELSRPAALFGGVVYAWQGDLVPFVLPGHYGYITTWPFFAVAAWAALRARRTRHWAYAILSGAACGIMVELQPDRGAIASLLIAALYASVDLNRPDTRRMMLDYLTDLRHLALCAATALLISLAAFLALFQSNIEGVKLGGHDDPTETYRFVTQYSLGPEETLTYLVPGFFGWHINNQDGPYWGEIGRTLDWPKNPNGTRNSNLAISTTGTVATVLALIGVGLLLPGGLLGPSRLTRRQIFYGRLLLALGFATLIFSWGWHTSLYRLLFTLPFMDKWRNPLKWLEMTNFALVTLSAFGVQHLLTSLAGTPEARIVRRRLAWFSGGLLVLLGLGLLASYPYAAYVLPLQLQQEGYDLPAIANIMSTLHTSLLMALVFMALFCLLLHAFWRPEWLHGRTLDNPMLHRLWQNMLTPRHLPLTLTLGLALLCAAQLGWVVTKFVEPIKLELLTQSNPLLDELKSQGKAVRVSVATDDVALSLLLLNQFSADSISCLDISAASRIPDDINTFFRVLDDDRTRLWLLAGVKNVVVPQAAFVQMRADPLTAADIDHADGYMLEATSSPDLPSHALVQIHDYLAKATLVPHAELLPTDEALLKRLADPAWNPRDSVLLTSKPREEPEGGADATAGTPGAAGVDLTTYTSHDIGLQVQANRPGCYVLINDQYDPDWQVQVNGRDAELLRADYIMRAVQVPPGPSTITMHYVAHYHVAGLNPRVETMNTFSDGAMLIAWALAGIALWRRRPLPSSIS